MKRERELAVMQSLGAGIKAVVERTIGRRCEVVVIFAEIEGVTDSGMNILGVPAVLTQLDDADIARYFRQLAEDFERTAGAEAIAKAEASAKAAVQ